MRTDKHRYLDDKAVVAKVLGKRKQLFTDDVQQARLFDTEAEAKAHAAKGWYVDAAVGKAGVKYIVTTYYGACTVYLPK